MFLFLKRIEAQSPPGSKHHHHFEINRLQKTHNCKNFAIYWILNNLNLYLHFKYHFKHTFFNSLGVFLQVILQSQYVHLINGFDYLTWQISAECYWASLRHSCTITAVGWKCFQCLKPRSHLIKECWPTTI